MSVATDLASLQRTLQRLILLNAADARDVVHAPDPMQGGERLGIYASAYRIRLIEALAANYPMLRTHLGHNAFGEIALAYLDDHPSTYVSIRTFGVQLPAWLELRRVAEPWLAEFAALEWALGCAFDSLDSTAICMDALANLRPDDWATLTFRFSSTVRRLSFKTNAPSLYEAAANAQTPLEGRTSDATQWLVWRHDLRAQYRLLSLDEAAAFDALLAGVTFAEACEQLAQIGDEASVPLRAAAFLKRWLLDELVIALRTEPVP